MNILQIQEQFSVFDCKYIAFQLYDNMLTEKKINDVVQKRSMRALGKHPLLLI